MDRRTFLRWVAGAGASGAGLGLTGRKGDPQPTPSSVVRRPDRWLSPVQDNPHARPGIWTMFATTCRECPAGCGMYVRTREGRVVKPEGNPDHPVSRGGLCPRGQSAPQGLYDPDRIRRPLRRSSSEERSRGSSRGTPDGDRNEPRNRPTTHEPLSWSRALAEVTAALKNAKRLFLVSDLQTGSLAEIMRQFHRAVGLPGAVAFYEAFDYEPLRAAHGQLLGRAVIPRYRLQESDFVLSFGAEFLETWLSNVEFAWQFAQMHHRSIADFGFRISDSRQDGAVNPQSTSGNPQGGEMACLEPRLSLTAANADYFLQTPAGQEHAAALAILQEVVRLKGLSISDSTGGIAKASGLDDGLAPNLPLREIARRLASARNAVVLPGPAAATGPAAERLATIALQLNQAVGALGRTVDFSQTHALGSTTPVAQIEEMIRDLGPEDVLIVHQTNPAYSLPHLRESLGRAGHLLYLGDLMNETARMARWVLPVHSPLEAWGDYEPWTGVHCLMQPTMGALADSRHSGDIFLSLAADSGRPLQTAGQTSANSVEPQPTSFYDWLRLDWRQLHERVARDTEFEAFWQQALQRGGYFETPQETGPVLRVRPVSRTETPARSALADSPGGIAKGSALDDGGGRARETIVKAKGLGDATRVTTDPPSEKLVYLWLWPSIKLFDGRLANRGWLQEVPERLSTISWGSWIDISAAKARQMQVADGDVLEVANETGRVKVPVRITDEVADNVVALALGQGHTALGEVAAGVGVNGFELRGRSSGDSLFGVVTLRKTGERCRPTYLSATQEQYGRGIVRWTTPEDLRSLTKTDIEEIIWPGPRGYDPHRDLYAPHEYPEHRWAMVIDLDRCIGCGACEVACYAENSVPVVGPGPLGLGRTREMTWLRVPPYRDADEPRRVGFLPLPCQHCDAAPCEPVCPVFAAVHNDQGLNAQIYNRCIGTRYCSNNCPYKVRRFNWFDPHWREPLNLQLNPDVTVRCRGVMEKCTFCIQRIHYHERLAKVEGRSLRDGEVVPACVQSCPTGVFVFGDLMLSDSRVSQFFEHPRRYQLLKELNTKPAVVYLKRIKPQSAETRSTKFEIRNKSKTPKSQ